MSSPVAIVTGGASGIGEAVVKHLIGKGYKVVIADLNTKAGESLAKELGPNALFHHTDVAKYSEQTALFKKAFTWGGNRLDFLAANAGVDDRQNLFDPEIALDSNGDPLPLDLTTINVDLIGVIQGIWLFRHYARQNKKPGGKIVVTSSMAGLYSAPINPQYITAKHALIGLARSTGAAMINENITVNCVCPGVIVTPLMPPAVQKLWPKERDTPMSTALKAYDEIIARDDMTGQVVELSLDKLYYRDQVPYASDTQRWIIEDAGEIWAAAYAPEVLGH